MAIYIGPMVAEAPETRQRYRRLRAFNIAVGVLLAAEALYMLLASNDKAVVRSHHVWPPTRATAPELPQLGRGMRAGWPGEVCGDRVTEPCPGRIRQVPGDISNGVQLGGRVFVGEVWELAEESDHLDRARRPAANVLTGYRDIGQVNHSDLIRGLVMAGCRGPQAFSSSKDCATNSTDQDSNATRLSAGHRVRAAGWTCRSTWTDSPDRICVTPIEAAPAGEL
jgi:hypothetical protein